jgi:hypothetical protein
MPSSLNVNVGAFLKHLSVTGMLVVEERVLEQLVSPASLYAVLRPLIALQHLFQCFPEFLAGRWRCSDIWSTVGRVHEFESLCQLPEA